MMMVGLVADGTIGSLDDKASKYVPWWTTDPEDLKSTVTLRHLLSFTSAFGGGIPGQDNTTKTCMDSNKTTDYMACAQQIFAQTNLSGTPGAFYSCDRPPQLEPSRWMDAIAAATRTAAFVRHLQSSSR